MDSLCTFEEHRDRVWKANSGKKKRGIHLKLLRTNSIEQRFTKANWEYLKANKHMGDNPSNGLEIVITELHC